ncbi:MAG: putative capsid protein [Cressdnaviricota sp.]|nr:MAG: putative capsid protein [Cressdnaviricota sp.]
MVLGKRRGSFFSSARRVKRRTFRGASMARRAGPRSPRRSAQRRFTKRAGWAVGRTSQSGAVRRAGYNSRRLGLSSYRYKLYDTSRFKTHWRSTAANTEILQAPQDANLKTFQLTTAWGGRPRGSQSVPGADPGPAFWEAGGGLRELDSTNPAFGQFVDLTIRGGRYWRRYTNLGSGTLRVERFELYRKRKVDISPTELFSGTETLGWDPTYIPDFQERYRVERKFVTDLEPGDTYTIENKIPVAKVDQGLWGNGAQRPWVCTMVTSDGGENRRLEIQSWFSVSFVGDRTEREEVEP